MSDTHVVRRSSELIEAEVDGEIVALHVDSGTCYGFNSTATRIWALVEQPRSVGQIRDVLVAEYEVDPDTCEAELVALLGELESDRMVEIDRSA